MDTICCLSAGWGAQASRLADPGHTPLSGPGHPGVTQSVTVKLGNRRIPCCV